MKSGSKLLSSDRLSVLVTESGICHGATYFHVFCESSRVKARTGHIGCDVSLSTSGIGEEVLCLYESSDIFSAFLPWWQVGNIWCICRVCDD